MIVNILILLLTNTILPYIPLPPIIIAPLPLAHFIFKEPTVYEHMNLSRVHTQEQFKRSFRDSLKVLHPDRGGDQVAFSRVKNLKKIMEQQINYYDTLNITDTDLEYNMPMKDIVKVKQISYYVQAGIYYFIVLLFVLAFTIEDDMRSSRKILLPIIVIFAAYEAFIHFHPQITTVIDLFHDKIPIFLQKKILKTMLSTIIAIIRTKYSRSLTTEKKLLKQLDPNIKHTAAQYKDIMKGLMEIYQEKVKAKIARENGFGAKIRGWIGKAFTLLVIFSIAKGFFSGGDGKADVINGHGL